MHNTLTNNYLPFEGGDEIDGFEGMGELGGLVCQILHHHALYNFNYDSSFPYKVWRVYYNHIHLPNNHFCLLVFLLTQHHSLLLLHEYSF